MPNIKIAPLSACNIITIYNKMPRLLLPGAVAHQSSLIIYALTSVPEYSSEVNSSYDFHLK